MGLFENRTVLDETERKAIQDAVSVLTKRDEFQCYLPERLKS